MVAKTLKFPRRGRQSKFPFNHLGSTSPTQLHRTFLQDVGRGGSSRQEAVAWSAGLKQNWGGARTTDQQGLTNKSRQGEQCPNPE